MRQVVAMVLGIATFLAAAVALAQEPARVSVLFICDEAVSRSTFTALERDNVDLTGALEIGACQRFPFPLDLEIAETIAGPQKDYQGDWMYLVRVGAGVYAIAWPAFNTTIPAPSGA